MSGNRPKCWDFQGFGANVMPNAEGIWEMWGYRKPFVLDIPMTEAEETPANSAATAIPKSTAQRTDQRRSQY
jgi:hypothetical protein